jgi:hypothetical protein
MKSNRVKRNDWENATGLATYQEIKNGKTVTFATFSRRLQLNTDPLKNRVAKIGKGMKKAWVRRAVGTHKNAALLLP